MAPLGRLPGQPRQTVPPFLTLTPASDAIGKKGHCACAIPFLPGSFVHGKAVEALFLRLAQTPQQGRWVSLPCVEGLRRVAWFPAGERPGWLEAFLVIMYSDAFFPSLCSVQR